MQRYLTGEYKDNVEPSMGAALAIKKWEEQKVALWVSLSIMIVYN
jgi:hypothetical protein